MPGSWRQNRAAAIGALALSLAVTLVTACGGAHENGKTSQLRSSAAADPPKATTAGGRTSPSAGRTQAPASPAASNSAPPTKPHAIPPAHPVPAAFQPAPGAPSDAEVREQLAKLEALKRQEHHRALSAAAASLAELLPWTLEQRSGVQVSVASVFTDYGLGLACGGVLGRDQLGVAHKTAPCGTLITFAYGGRVLTVPVIDRGPYIAGREWDLTGATAAALGFPGLGRIEWSVAR
jgi:rare lipoprotein A (peptidoglycan hydrolase)